MAMDFFEHQEAARKRSSYLVLLFALAILGIIAVVYAVLAFVMTVRGDITQVIQWELLGAVTLGVLCVVGLSSLYKIVVLRSGGEAVATMMKGRLVHAHTQSRQERKLLNVVEEMAIASGVPAPPVYILDHERGINAFAAGYSPSDAVIGVTRGCVEQLSRDELQGVIAHEFSHILNGDMRLNIHLLGLVFGILVLGLIGYQVLRASAYGSHRSRKGGSATLVFLLLALTLVVVGYVGSFFGNWIKAAVSRQREFLADASAVQFTRNPGGLAGALKKIGGFVRGSKLKSQHATEISHMLFGQGSSGFLASLFASHPPLKERILRVEPDFDGAFPTIAGPRVGEAQQETVGFAPLQAGEKTSAAVGAPGSASAGSARAINQIGLPREAHIKYARELVATLPDSLKDAAHEPHGARALINTLLLHTSDDSRSQQLASLEKSTEKAVYQETVRLSVHTKSLERRARLPLVDLALPTLKRLSARQYASFRKDVIQLIQADGRVDVFEWTLSKVVLHHLERTFGRTRTRAPAYYALNRLAEPCSTLLSTVAHVGHAKHDEAQTAFQAAAVSLGIQGLSLQPSKNCGLRALEDAHLELNRTAPRCKRELLLACAIAICHDHRVTTAEGELLRAIADTLDCPMPPILPGQPLV